MKIKVAIIGGGAAGFFSAITAKENNPKAEVVIFEKSTKLLAKVKVSGGGRCNVTHDCKDPFTLATFYPRGGNYLKKAFQQFHVTDTLRWFEKRGIKMKTYPDGCIFPISNDSQTIINCFLSETKRLGISIKTSSGVTALTKEGEEYILTVNNEQVNFDRVIITTGGQPKKSGLDWLSSLGLEIVDPVPSLFTFNMPNNPICKLMGTVINPAHVKVEGTKLQAAGPLLITHWGMSGPAILLLSAWGARVLHEKEYAFNILVNWLQEKNEESLRGHFKNMKVSNENKMMVNYSGLPLTQRLWEFLIEKAGVPTTMRWKDFGTKNENKLLTVLLQDRYSVKGKTTFKEEFVTAGGISMMEVDVHRMEVKKYPGLHVAGEVLDIDGITGGFNFQAAWTTGYIAGKSAVR